MVTTMTMMLQFRVTAASGSSLLDILGPWSGTGCPLLPDPTAYQVWPYLWYYINPWPSITSLTPIMIILWKVFQPWLQPMIENIHQLTATPDQVSKADLHFDQHLIFSARWRLGKSSNSDRKTRNRASCSADHLSGGDLMIMIISSQLWKYLSE